MTEATVSSPAPRRRGRWLRVLGWAFGVFIVLVVIIYFVGTSSAFFKGVIVPRVSKSINADVAVGDASISPFKEVILRNVTVRTGGQEPLVSASEVRARYNLMDILRGNINVDEITLASPTIVVVENPDGSHNYDALKKAAEEKPKAKETTAAKPSKPALIDVKKIALIDATVRYVKLYKGGARDVTELSHVNVTADQVKNGQSGKFALSADIKVENNPPAPKTNGLLQAKLNGNFTFALSGDLKPVSIQGKTRLEVVQATGGMAELVALGADLDCEVSPTDIKQVALQFQKGGTKLGEVRVSGPFDMEKTEGHLTVQILSIDKKVLNLAGAKSGVDFGTTLINSTNEIDVAKSGSVFGLKGQFKVDGLQIVSAGQTNPPLDLLATYEVTPTDIKQVSVQFRKDGAGLGEVKASGPFDMEKKEGHLAVQILSIDKQVLNLAGAKSGIDFGTTVINCTNEVEIAKSASFFTVRGQLKVDKFQVTQNGQTSPPLDLVLSYDETADTTAETNLLKTFTLVGTQRGNPLLKGELTSPMTLAWGKVTNAVGDSALNLTVTHLNLADWKPFIGDSASAGDVNLKLTLLAQQQGKKLTFDLDSRTDNLTAGSGSNQITQATVTLQARGEAADLKRFNLTNYKLQVTRQNDPIVSASGSGTYDTEAKNADMQFNAQIMLAKLMQALGRSDVNVSSGSAELKAHVVQTTQSPGTKNESTTRNISGGLNVTGFTGKFGNNQFQSFGSEMNLDVGLTPQQVQVRKLTGKLTEGPNAGGAFDVTATYDLTNKSAQFTAKLSDFNQNGLRPFLEPLLADKKLVSVGINASASGQYIPNGDSAIKADVQMANLVVTDPKNQLPGTPLEAKVQVDASIRKQVADVRQCQLTLTPTSRGKNELNLTGHMDMSQTNATTGNLKLAAESLDMTSYYDLFAGEKKPEEKKKTTSPTTQASRTSPAPAVVNKEPEGTKLPFRNFNAEITIGRFYLREVEITNLLSTTKIDGSRVLLNPFKLALNGAPVSTTVDLDMGVPGYKYDVAFNGQAIPLAPLVNTFQPERKGQIGGTLSAQAKIGGTGTTGASLKNTLTGQFDVSSTNLNLSVVNIKSRLLKTLVNVIATIPDLARNPTAIVGAASGKGGLSDDLAKSPIDVIKVRGVAGGGKVELQQSVVQSAAFKAEAAGTVALADVLTNSSIHIPVSVSLGRGVAEKLSLVPANTPTNEVYAKLPDFLTMKGTVGDPKTDINKVALAGTAFKTIGGVVSGLGGKSGGLIKGVGDLLTGTRSATNAPPTTGTNQPATSQSPVNDILNQLLKPKKK
jgi:uncharacterized protein involved in outer membrane biogenesis